MIIRNTQGITVEIESEKNVLVMESGADVANAAAITNSEGKEFKTASKVVNWPGEYEISGWLMKSVETEEGGLLIQAQVDGVHVLHLGSVKSVTDKDLENLDDTGVLILPVQGGIRTAEEAIKLGEKIEPRIIVPVGDLASQFVELSGAQDVEATPKATIKESSLPSDKTEIIHLMG